MRYLHHLKKASIFFILTVLNISKVHCLESEPIVLGTNYLKLKEQPITNTSFCAPPALYAMSATCMTERFPENELWITNRKNASLLFTIYDASYEVENVLVLAYSTKILPTPAVPTPHSKINLWLDLNFMEIMATHDLPTITKVESQKSTKIGIATFKTIGHFAFTFDLNKFGIVEMMDNGNTTIYVQAALLRKSDFLAGNFDGMILSEVDTLHFVEGDCPKGTDLEPLCKPIVEANDKGELYFPQH